MNGQEMHQIAQNWRWRTIRYSISLQYLGLSAVKKKQKPKHAEPILNLGGKMNGGACAQEAKKLASIESSPRSIENDGDV
jgi:hypothetical protein